MPVIKSKNEKSAKKRLKASVVFCNWNGGEYIIKALESIEKQTYKGIETIVVDNGSSDGSADRIEKVFKGIRLIRNAANLGFAGGNNVGIAAASGDIIFTINQDVILTEDFVGKILGYFKNAPGSVGSVGGKILRMDGNLIDSAGLRLSRARRFFDRGSEEIDDGQFDMPEEVFGICAAAAAYRKSMLEKISSGKRNRYFDERFYLLVEDVDLAWRARHCGYSAYYYPDAICYHIRGGAGWRNKTKQYLSFRNRCFMIIKNEYLINIFLAMPWFIFYDCPRLLYLIFSNRLTWKAMREIFRELPQLIKDRQNILNRSKMKPSEARKWMK
jgi:GT2 family glycosyltransferase